MMNPKVEFYFAKDQKWEQEIKRLRKIVLDSELTEELKWGCPCYSLNGKNIVLIHVFKEYCALLFFKGALLTDKKNKLIQQTENVQAARQIRFTQLKQVINEAQHITEMIREAIQIEQSGVKVPLKAKTELEFPEEFMRKLDEMHELKKAFFQLTPGRQRAYNLFFSAPKQSKTKDARIEKCIPLILNGKGLND
jgi:uncharacterized protein YdeI (YjbR/CyaY-like superfamily)